MWLTYDGVTCGYGGTPVLKDLCVRLGIGLWAVLGSNGAGKSALLACAAGVLRPQSGRLLWNGRDAYALAGRYRWHVGYMPQEPLEYGDLTPRAFLLYFAGLKGIRASNQAGRAQEVMDLVEVSEHADRPIASLSTGLRSRLALAQALLNDPDVLLLDEPTPGLDPEERVRFRNLLQDLARDRIVLLATNIPEEAVDIATGVLRLSGGRLTSTFCNSYEVTDGGDHHLRLDKDLPGGSRRTP